jgi:hypothetical protein
MMTARDTLLSEANGLGLSFAKNISTKKLQAMVDKANGLSATSSPPVPVKEEKAGIEDDHTGKPKSLREKIAASKKRALAKQVVTITNKDPRENTIMTTVHLSVENQHFGIARNVPLDVPVEIETCLIELAQGTNMTLHKDEIVRGQRTGNKIATSVKKFVISYGKQN